MNILHRISSGRSAKPRRGHDRSPIFRTVADKRNYDRNGKGKGSLLAFLYTRKLLANFARVYLPAVVGTVVRNPTGSPLAFSHTRKQRVNFARAYLPTVVGTLVRNPTRHKSIYRYMNFHKTLDPISSKFEAIGLHRHIIAIVS